MNNKAELFKQTILYYYEQGQSYEQIVYRIKIAIENNNLGDDLLIADALNIIANDVTTRYPDIDCSALSTEQLVGIYVSEILLDKKIEVLDSCANYCGIKNGADWLRIELNNYQKNDVFQAVTSDLKSKINSDIFKKYITGDTLDNIIKASLARKKINVDEYNKSELLDIYCDLMSVENTNVKS